MGWREGFVGVNTDRYEVLVWRQELLVVENFHELLVL